ncbi:MAG: hypothetical protein A2Y97_03535 [Nitrospirae bacterium RBG_13_39_12]|nr:MAG: hypothetical protein A2Y97_03535 [Nitrospirae bacterium RBG_13_39_12]
MDTKDPLVSIIVRTKDRPKLVKKALQSIPDQTYRPIEVILVNDGGCDLDIDEFKSILGDIFLNYKRLHKNMGRAHAGNVGIENAKGAYVGFLDDDDILYGNHVSTLVGYLESSGEDAAYTDAYAVKNILTKEGYIPHSKEIVHARNFNRDWLLFQNYIPLLCLVVRKELLTKEIFDTEFDIFEDWEILIRLSQNHNFHRIPEVTAEYHLRDDNATIVFNPGTLEHVETRYKVYRKHMNLLRERGIGIFELLYSESERYKELYNLKNQEFDRVNIYMQEKEEELSKACKYIKEKEEELSKACKYIKEKEEELESVKAYARKKEEELIKVNIYIKEKEEEFKRKKEGMVSVIILTYNGEYFLKNLLDSIYSQEIDQPIEVILIDSLSEDSTCKIAETYNIKIHAVEKKSFSHSKTRNYGVSLSKGKYIVFITQDAIPINTFWLKELIKPFENYSNLAATYSRQVPMADCNPLEAKDIYIGAPCIDEVRYSDLDLDLDKKDYMGNIHRYIRFSNVSACYRGDLLRNNLFDERLKMVEDQEWAKRMIEKGYAVYYASKSIVKHSHDFSIKEIYNRFFDYGSSFKKFLLNNPPRRTSCIKATIYDSVNDIFYILNDKRRMQSKLKWICLSPFLRFSANYGLYRGWRHG